MMSGMAITVHRTAEITVGLPRDQAMELFTAEGERRWASGWDPHYPVAARRDGPGAVFTTAHGGRQTTWIMIDHRPEAICYARVTHELTAGTVAVDVLAADDDTTRVGVSYDLTTLSAEGEEWLTAFDGEYDSFIAAWGEGIASAL